VRTFIGKCTFVIYKLFHGAACDLHNTRDVPDFGPARIRPNLTPTKILAGFPDLADFNTAAVHVDCVQRFTDVWATRRLGDIFR